VKETSTQEVLPSCSKSFPPTQAFRCLIGRPGKMGYSAPLQEKCGSSCTAHWHSDAPCVLGKVCALPVVASLSCESQDSAGLYCAHRLPPATTTSRVDEQVFPEETTTSPVLLQRVQGRGSRDHEQSRPTSLAHRGLTVAVSQRALSQSSNGVWNGEGGVVIPPGFNYEPFI